MLIYKDCTESEDLHYTCDPCNETEGGGVRSLCLIKKGTTLQNPLTKIGLQALIAQNKLWVMPETRGTFDGGTPKMAVGYGDKKERQIGSDYVLQVKDPVYSENAVFWGQVENIQDWNIAFRTETQLAVVYDDTMITTKDNVEEGLDTELVWNIECKWFSKSKPVLIAYPKGLFLDLKPSYPELDSYYQGGNVYSINEETGKIVIVAALATTGHQVDYSAASDYESQVANISAYNAGESPENGYSDWRLPTLAEGLLIVQKVVANLIANGEITNDPEVAFWVSDYDNETQGFVVLFSEGIASFSEANLTDGSIYAFAVRTVWTKTPALGDLYGGGQVVLKTSEKIYIALLNAGNELDINGGGGISFVNYLSNISDFNTDSDLNNGKTDWRNPTHTELQAIMPNMAGIKGFDSDGRYWAESYNGDNAYTVMGVSPYLVETTYNKIMDQNNCFVIWSENI